MTEESTLYLENSVKKTTIISNFVGIAVALVTALAVCTGFYFRTQFAQQETDTNIESLTTTVNDIQRQTAINTTVNSINSSEINNLKACIVRIETNQNRIEDKIDRLLLQSNN